MQLTLSLLWTLVLGCVQAAPEDTALDCSTLGGGFAGVDIEEIEATCRESGGEGCESDSFVESDAAVCYALAHVGLPQSDYEAYPVLLGYAFYDRTVVWLVEVKPEGPGETCDTWVHATTGEIFPYGCKYYEPR